jgi:predicted nucleic acid-binding Zn ribbon protein
MAQALGKILNQVLERYGLAQRAKEIEALNLWPEVVGEKIAKVTEAKDVREGRLFVKVENSVWRNELYYLKQDFINALNRRLGQVIVNDIVFV